MSKAKTKQTTAAAAASEPIVVNGVEFTPKMIADLTQLANLETEMKEDKKNTDKLKGVYKPFSKRTRQLSVTDGSASATSA